MHIFKDGSKIEFGDEESITFPKGVKILVTDPCYWFDSEKIGLWEKFCDMKDYQGVITYTLPEGKINLTKISYKTYISLIKKQVSFNEAESERIVSILSKDSNFIEPNTSVLHFPTWKLKYDIVTAYSTKDDGFLASDSFYKIKTGEILLSRNLDAGGSDKTIYFKVELPVERKISFLYSDTEHGDGHYGVKAGAIATVKKVNGQGFGVDAGIFAVSLLEDARIMRPEDFVGDKFYGGSVFKTTGEATIFARSSAMTGAIVIDTK